MSKTLSPHTLVYGFNVAADPNISPDGSKVAFTRTVTDETSGKPTTQIWLTQTAGGEPRQLTFAGKANTWPRWSPDGAELAFVSDRAEKFGIFVLPMAGGGEAREVARTSAGASELAWSPDGSRIAYVALYDPANPSGEKPPADAPPPVRATSRIDYKQDGFGYLGEKRAQVFVVDACGGEAKMLTGEANTHSSPAWSPDGRQILYRIGRDNGMTGQLATVSPDGGPVTTLTPEGWTVSTWAWSPDGARVIFSGEPERTGQTDFYALDVASKTVRQITDDLPCLPDSGFAPFFPPAQPVWSDDHTLLFHAFHRGRSGTWQLDVNSGSVSEVESENELRTYFSTDASRALAVQATAGIDHVGSISLVDLKAGRSQQLVDGNAAVLKGSTPRWERFDVVRDGFTIEAWLLLPADFDQAKTYPLVLDIHGGPQGHYGFGFVPYQQVLATNGIAVLYSNPRGSSSYGRQFAKQVLGDWGGEDYRDLMAVVDEALKRPYFDADRVGIWGYSYGGYMTAWTISQNHLFKAAVCGAPCFDLESMFGTSDISHFFGVMNWTEAPWNAREWYATHSPSQFAHNTRTPTLIIHGEADERCPIGQGEQMFVTLKKAGCDVEFVRYPGGYHGFLRGGPAAHREDFLQRILDWFQSRL